MAQVVFVPEHASGVQMDVSFTAHLDQLIDRLKSELVQHYERDLATNTKGREDEVTCSSPHILRFTASKSFLHGVRSPKALLNRRASVDSDGSSDELEMPRVHHRLHSKSAVSDSDEATVTSTESLELKTPKHIKASALVPQVPHPTAPKDNLRPFMPSAAPKMLIPAKAAQVAPIFSDTESQEAVSTPAVTGTTGVTAVSPVAVTHVPIPIPQTEDTASVSDTASQVPSPAQHRHYSVNQDSKRRGTKDSQRTSKTSKTSGSSSTSTSSASFASSSDGEAPRVALPNSRLTMKRPSNASISLFFRREPAVSRIWLFLQDPDSSAAAWYYANIMNYFITFTIIFTIWQAAADPPVSRLIEGIMQISVEGIFFVEFMLHWCFSAERLAFLKNPYNIIDFLAIIPIGFRIAYGISTPEMDSNYAPVHFLLYCFVPVIRQLKLIRKFQKLQLLLHVLSTTFDALKLLLFLVCLIVLFFGCLLYVLEPQQTQSLSEYIYQCTVTVTTVGTCDMAPTTWPGKIIAGMLCVISVLFMAMPISVLGNAMSNTWADRHRILLMTQTRRRLKNLGYTAEDMPKLFKKFDKDGNGDLEMEEFCDLVATMRVGIKPSEASELFMAFDSNGDGGISEMEFMKALFPLDYRRIYRRMSGMTFGA
ncbi:Potassium voltage-gated channel subfamily B member 2 (Voltage-gated potassium channel subunit Kv2.2) [Durusdinium trenchii]